MNRALLIIWILMGTLFSVQAQPTQQEFSKEKHEKIKALKVEYITTKLELTSAEAEKFWPVYNEFEKQLHDLQRGRRKHIRQFQGQELSDEQMNELIEFNFKTEQQILDLKRSYDNKFKKVLSIQKVGKLYMAEASFKKELIRKMRGNHGPPH